MNESMRYVVLTVPNSERLENIQKLKEQIPELEVFTDINKEKFKFLTKVWEELQNDEILWLEDDVILCKNFKKRLEQELDFYGKEHVVNFFYGGKGDSSISKKLNGKQFLWNQCTFYPKGYTKKFLDFYNSKFKYFTHFKPCEFNYDNCIAYAIEHHKDFYYLSRPNLVQHLDIDSSISKKPRGRISKYFIDDLPFEIPIVKHLSSKKFHCEYVSIRYLFANLNTILKTKQPKKKNLKEIEFFKNNFSIPYLEKLSFQQLYAMKELGYTHILVYVSKLF